MKKKNMKKHGGFTLVQMVIVMVIFVILTVASFANSNAYIQQANMTNVINDLKGYSLAFENAFLNEMHTVANYDDTEATATETFAVNVLNPYLTPELAYNVVSDTFAKLDPWGNAYQLYVNDATAPLNGGITETYVVVYSTGGNGISGTSDTWDDDDIVMVVQYRDGTVRSELFDCIDSAGVDYNHIFPDYTS